MAEKPELFAERLRKAAQAENPQGLEDALDDRSRTKICELWGVAVDDARARNMLGRHSEPGNVRRRTRLSIGCSLTPTMISSVIMSTSPEALSIIEACHEALLEEECYPEADNYRDSVNRVFEAHHIGYFLKHDSMIIPVESRELQNSVVSPAVQLLHTDGRFQAAELAYANALREIREDHPDDAITDAATALQETFAALGIEGSVLGKQISAAKQAGLLGGVDSPLRQGIENIANWVATRRNNGEAHTASHNISLDEAWLVVHTVGALIVFLASVSSAAEPTQPEEDRSL